MDYNKVSAKILWNPQIQSQIKNKNLHTKEGNHSCHWHKNKLVHKPKVESNCLCLGILEIMPLKIFKTSFFYPKLSRVGQPSKKLAIKILVEEKKKHVLCFYNK
jgi:hypothetical protein